MNQFKNFKSNFSQFSCKSIPVKLQKTFLICAHICYKSFTMSQKYLILIFFQFLSKIGDLRRPDASIPGKLQNLNAILKKYYFYLLCVKLKMRSLHFLIFLFKLCIRLFQCKYRKLVNYIFACFILSCCLKSTSFSSQRY